MKKRDNEKALSSSCLKCLYRLNEDDIKISVQFQDKYKLNILILGFYILNILYYI